VTTAVIMAGGRSTRMRPNAGSSHKALVRVMGVPMLERNLCALLSAEIHDIVVAINANEPEIAAYVRDRGQELARARRATLDCLQEITPLGTIGVARELRDRSDALLVVNVDNLTAIDLSELVGAHRRTSAALTIATHMAELQIPFGEVEIMGGQITAYTEKPVKRIRISSGTYVLSAKACGLIREGRRTDLPDLFATLLQQGETIQPFEHNAAWIDVNDAAAADEAEKLITSKYLAFEHWKQTPDAQVADLLLHSPQGILAEFRPESASRYPTQWDIPGEELVQDRSATPRETVETILKELDERPATLQFLVSFDDLDVASGRVLRHHVFSMPTNEERPLARAGTERKWFRLEDTGSMFRMSPAIVRSFAFYRRRR
jgi:dTDP-glucose pyrophosphorylase